MLLQAAVYGTGALSVAAGIPYLRMLRENRELFKARLFLDYERYVSLWQWAALGLAAAVVVGLVFTLLPGPSAFMELFLPYGVITLLFDVAILYIAVTIYRIVREAE
ncbi:MAG: hypothetical protein HY558_03245 [Euryarchaeota archaeon]|nr:hypothetical protein [Euryarchaeota archaeon]